MLQRLARSRPRVRVRNPMVCPSRFKSGVVNAQAAEQHPVDWYPLAVGGVLGFAASGYLLSQQQLTKQQELPAELKAQSQDAKLDFSKLAPAEAEAEEGKPPAALFAVGSMAYGDLTNFDPEPTEDDPYGAHRLSEAFAASVLRHGMKVMHQGTVVFPEDGETRPGFTLVVLIDASHCTAHCYSDTKQLSIDCFTCGSTDPILIYEDAVKEIKAMSPGVQVASNNQLPRFDSAAPGLARRSFMQRAA